MTLDPITDYVLFVKAARLISCPRCKAGPHAPCVSNTGRPRIEGFHAARRKAAEALPWEVAERLVAEDEERQRLARASIAPLTPAQIATRKAMSDAWKAMNLELAVEERKARERCHEPYYHPETCYCRHGRPAPLPQPKPVGQAAVADLNTERARRRTS